ncbi:MAG: hypothetical protein ISS33_02570 [Candidatus Omnitrophica bacterium]|nr:hypothetical protein [Candidatus Omnitrophota bacterium]
MGIGFFLMRVVLFAGVLYLAYCFYRSLRKPVGEKAAEVVAACPSPKVFIDYTEGRIKGKEKKAIDEHIGRCKNCRDALKDVFDMPGQKS